VDDGDEIEIFFLHFLVVAAALFCLSCADEQFHRLEYLVHASHVSVHEVSVVYLQKPMVFFVLFSRPMPTVHVHACFGGGAIAFPGGGEVGGGAEGLSLFWLFAAIKMILAFYFGGVPEGVGVVVDKKILFLFLFS
jgi:hypothetical protein